MSEKILQSEIISYIRALGGWCQRINSGSMRVDGGSRGSRYIKMADRGTPDILACIKGRFIGIEVKRDEQAYKNWKKESDSTSEAQHMQAREITSSGGAYLCVYELSQLEQDFRVLNIL